MYCIICFLLIGFFGDSSALAIDTKLWEGAIPFIAMSGKTNKENLCMVTQILLCEAYIGKGKHTDKELIDLSNYFESKYEDKNNVIRLKLTPVWNGITGFTAGISANTSDSKYVKYYFIFNFEKGALTLLDVIGRYGIEYAQVETTSNLTNKITYPLSKYRDDIKKTLFYGTEYPLIDWASYDELYNVYFTFSSIDKVNVDELLVYFRTMPTNQ